MKTITKFAAATTMVLLSGAASASMINVGHVNWDPDYVDVTDYDFVGEFKFTQWYTSTVSTVGSGISAANYNNAVGINAVLGSLGGSGASGYFLQGVGEFDRINGGFSTGIPYQFMDAGYELTYAFGGIGLNKDSTFDLSQAWARLYVNKTTDYNYTTPADVNDVADAQTGNVWLDLDITALAFKTGSTVAAGFVDATLDVIGGEAAPYFVPTTLAYSASAQFSTTGAGGKYSQAGNGQVQGNTVPEPAPLALMGMGLVGLVVARRKAKAA